jgi:hypothetical protein
MTEPLILHRFVSRADEPLYLASGWMWERPLYSTYPFRTGTWMIWPCSCPPREPVPGSSTGGWWCRFIPATRRGAVFASKRMGGHVPESTGYPSGEGEV